MPAPTMPKAPKFLAHPDTFLYRPWASQIPYDSALTDAVREWLEDESVAIVGAFPDPTDFDRSSPFADPGPWLESNDTPIGWRVLGDSYTWRSTHWSSTRDEFFPFYIYNGRVLGMTTVYNQSSTYLGPGTFGDTHSFAWSRKWGTCQDSYITRAQLWEGFLSNVNALVMWSVTDTRFPTGTKDGDGTWNATYSGDRVGANAALLPYAPLLFTYDEALAGFNKHVLPMVVGALHVKSEDFNWPAAHSDGQSATAPLEYGMFTRISADFDFSRIPETITGTNRIVVEAWIRTMQKYGAVLMDVGANEAAGFVAAANPNITSAANNIWAVLTWDDFDFFTIDDHMIDEFSMEAS